ncbi:MAG: hypothetical protein DI560_23765 [Pseudomonas putida]|nr:MAG: hypothetical protein DI560_23765 [Pseudomonas putida]
MKKLVPDPPRLRVIATPYFSIHSDMPTPDALAHASELLRGVAETIHCRTHAGEPGLNMLSNAAHACETSRALIEHALTDLYDAQRQR